jgi:hypothetical protein
VDAGSLDVRGVPAAGGICTEAALPAASLTEWSVVAGAAPSGTAAPSNCADSTSTACGTLTANHELTANQSLTSCNGDYTLTMQGDGNLVLYQGSTALWASNTAGTGADEAIMQGDGNFVVYTSAGSPLWASGTAGNPRPLTWPVRGGERGWGPLPAAVSRGKWWCGPRIMPPLALL